MSIIHDILKIRYSKEGYLPDYPYHMISDKEMFDAFINNKDNFFSDNYSCPDEDFQEICDRLKEGLIYHINQYLEDDSYKIPVWVYSYMIGSVITNNSDERDRRDYIELLGLPPITSSIFTHEVYTNTYSISEDVISKLPSDVAEHRPATIFGEPDVVKQLLIYQSI